MRLRVLPGTVRVAFALVLAACGTSEPGASMGPEGNGPSCAGCLLSSGECVAGDRDAVCGTAGTRCVSCSDPGQRCVDGACQCVPACDNKVCGASDGCGGICLGRCPEHEWCDFDGTCSCGPRQSYKRIDGICYPACGELLRTEGLSEGACCAGGCGSGVWLGPTWDCYYCCSVSTNGPPCR